MTNQNLAASQNPQNTEKPAEKAPAGDQPNQEPVKTDPKSAAAKA